MSGLTIGSTVHYTDNPNHGGGHARCFDAEVTSINPDGTVDVRESLLPGKPPNPAYAIREGKPGDLYTWHWPEPVNAVNRPIASATAHKLRSAAAAILADAAKQADARLADSLMYEAGEIRARADSIEEQVKPAIEEPFEFGSVVRTRTEGLFVRLGADMGLPWGSGGTLRAWDHLDVVEVLRVGIGEPEPLAQWETDLLNEQEVRDVASAVLSAMDVDQYLIDAVTNARPDGFCVCPPDGRAKDCGIRRHRVEALA